ncbi:tRNA preQ1(34) S-adenosylmethionine ribosyltransferase-isomerase QueA [Feifania hominis]|uniref:S-adenosylmethionine:tRNA ribosyltransferase-isomerase n=1 Tax=Feifania hominis TaxID=2763660 RepID=A0A926HT69_9FIRM|nr:tRNA preQ1(34) S-adenosylmethionine ribosyltransferase-isomerase QueA [Feifania hominis]MBC8535564.1 tRNA preQ1(34) S-adenosylmethionine ribosyltransferase-isomerase QueA [Feifania hominis]
MKLSEFNYDLPPELIAQTPIEQRDESRLLVLDRTTGALEHRIFHDLPEYLRPGDVLVLNDSKVLPARLYGVRDTGAVVEFVLLKQLPENRWETLVRPGRRAKPGDHFTFGGGLLHGEILEIIEEGIRIVEFSHEGNFFALLDEIGSMPLPPYITESLKDNSRYQTVYAKHLGSAAAPTAGLHFTPELLEQIAGMGVLVEYVTLHVGLGTFRPVKEQTVEEHTMHSEWYTVSEETAAAVNAAKAAGGRVIAVGTTSCRTLESATDDSGILQAKSDDTNIFIYPGYRFKMIDALITNFHLPESTLIMLVSALAGKENIFAAYEQAIRRRYRFFSFGDAMLIK